MKDSKVLTQFWAFDGESKVVSLVKELRGELPDRLTNLAGESFVSTIGNDVIAPPISYYLVAELLNRNVYHSFCINFKKDLATNFGLDYDNWKNVPNKLKKFVERPNDVFDDEFINIIKKSVFDYITFNRMTNEVARGTKSTALYHVNAKNMYLKASKDLRRITEYVQLFTSQGIVGSPIRVYKRGDNGFGSFIMAREEYSPDSNLYGMPTYLSAIASILGTETIENYINSFFENNARPDFMVLITGQPMNDQQKDALRTTLLSLKGVGNGHKALYLNFDNPDVKVEIKELSKGFDESFRNIKTDYRDAIATIHGVPPKILGFGSASGLGGGTDSIGALKTIVDVVVAPIQETIARFYNAFLENEFGFNPKLYLKKANINSDKDMAIISDLLKNSGIITVNEARELNNYPAVEGKENEVLVYNSNSSKNLGIEQDSIYNLDADKNNAFSSQTNESLSTK